MLRVVIALLIRVFAFIATLWIIKRLLRPGFVWRRQAHGQAPDGKNNSPNKMVKDPICGMYMDPRLAIQADQKGEALYFCSEECRQKFLNGQG